MSGVSRRHKRGCDRRTGCGCPWQYWCEKVTAEGVRRQVNRSGFATKREAVEARQRMVADIQAGRIEPGKGRLTVGEFLAEWLEARSDPHSGGRVLRPSTARSYSMHVRVHIVPRLGRVRLRDLTSEHIEAMYRQMREAGTSDATIRHTHAVLRSAVSYSIKKGYLPADPLARVELRPVEQYRASPWTPDEWQQFRAHAEQSRLWPVIRLAVDAGMRRGELLGLRWTDLDLDAGKITVAHTRTEVGSVVVAGVPKSGKPRTVIVTPGTVAVLRAWRTRQTEERLRLGEAWMDTGLVFTDEAGAGLLPGSVSQTFRALAEQAGVRRCRFHDLRHLSAILGLAAGESLHEVSDRLGHGSVAITEQVYAHLLDDARRTAAAKRAAML